MKFFTTAFVSFVFGLMLLPTIGKHSSQAQEKPAASLSESLSFFASFDHGIDADVARGDKALWQAPNMNKREEATKGLPGSGEVALVVDGGKFGSGLRFTKSAGPIVFFKALNNLKMPAHNWTGTISFWLKTDPAHELREGFCDPIQITSKQWDDAAIFVEFEKRSTGIPFRLGVYADKKIWNPTGRKFDDIPPAERPPATVEKPPFAAGKWTHVCVAFEDFNTGKANGVATLYLDGSKSGELTSREQTFTWDPQHAAIMLGLGYVGSMDELAMFDRTLSANEIKTLYSLKSGITELMPAK